MVIFQTYESLPEGVLGSQRSPPSRRCGGAAVVSDHDFDQFLPQRLRRGGSVSLANLAQRTAGAVSLGEERIWGEVLAANC